LALAEAVSYPHESLVGTHEDGVTEGWIAEAVCALLKASDARVVVELGGFLGVTSSWLALTLQKMGGGGLVVSEPDEDRRARVAERLSKLSLPDVSWDVSGIPSPQIISTFVNKTVGFAFVDNDHTKPHVEQEIVTLWDKMAPGGIMCFHDVWGVCDLQSVVKKYGGIALNLPRLGPAGGLGIIQVP
jgi:predicted O-methyltransferase YrrM